MRGRSRSMLQYALHLLWKYKSAKLEQRASERCVIMGLQINLGWSTLVTWGSCSIPMCE